MIAQGGAGRDQDPASLDSVRKIDLDGAVFDPQSSSRRPAVNINSCFMSQGRGGVQPRCRLHARRAKMATVVGTPDSTELGYRNQTPANIGTVLHALHYVATSTDHLGLAQPRWTMQAWLERAWCRAPGHYYVVCPGASPQEGLLSCKMFPPAEGRQSRPAWPD